MPLDQNPGTLATQSPAALVTTATSQPALRTGFAALALVSLLDLSTADRSGAPIGCWRWVVRRPQAGSSSGATGAVRPRCWDRPSSGPVCR